MTKDINTFKKERPDLVESYKGMSREELLKQCLLEARDAVNMEARVQVFMNECTQMSKTNYTETVIRGLIVSKQEHDIDVFCEDLLEDHITDKEIVAEVRRRAQQA